MKTFEGLAEGNGRASRDKHACNIISRCHTCIHFLEFSCGPATTCSKSNLECQTHFLKNISSSLLVLTVQAILRTSCSSISLFLFVYCCNYERDMNVFASNAPPPPTLFFYRHTNTHFFFHNDPHSGNYCYCSFSYIIVDVTCNTILILAS